MLTSLRFALVVALAAAAVAAQQPASPTDSAPTAPVDPAALAEADVVSAYALRTSPYAFETRLAGFSAAPDAAPPHAGAYLAALLARFRQDAVEKREPATHSVVMVDEPVDPTLAFRLRAVAALGVGAPPAFAVDALASLVALESDPSLVGAALDALLRSEDPRATAFLRRVVEDGVGGATPTLRAAARLRERGESPSPAAIARLANSPRRALRDLARDASARQGLPPPPEPTPAATFAAGDGAALLRALEELFGTSPLVLTDGEAAAELAARGAPDSSPAAEGIRIAFDMRSGKSTATLVSIPKGSVVDALLRALSGADGAAVPFSAGRLRAEARVVVGLRASLSATGVRRDTDEYAPPRDVFSPTGTWSDRRSDPFAFSLLEALLGVRLSQAGMAAESAEVLTPLLQGTFSDAAFVATLSLAFADELGVRMFERFAEHDVAGAAEFARRLIERLPECFWTPVARRFLAEAPARADDWTALRLPTPEEWEALLPTMSREAAIRYLAARVRLCVGFGAGKFMPGPLADAQSVDPPRVSLRSCKLLRAGRLPAINPLLVLRDGPLPLGEIVIDGRTGVGPKDRAILEDCARESFLVPATHSLGSGHLKPKVYDSAELLLRLTR
jgi:hypothetical protein